MDILFENLGETIKKIRKAKGLSQRELAKLAGVSDATISKLENNTANITMENIKKIVSALGFSFEEILKIAKEGKIYNKKIFLLNSPFLSEHNRDNKNNEEKIGKAIKKYREIKNLSLKELSEMTGLSIDLLYGIESGQEEIRISNLKKIADALKVTVDEILQEAEKDTEDLKDEEREKKDLKVFLNDVEGIMFYDGQPLNEDDIEIVKSILETLSKKKAKNNN